MVLESLINSIILKFNYLADDYLFLIIIYPLFSVFLVINKL